MRRRHQPRPLFWIALTVFILLAGMLGITLFGPASGSRRSVDVTIPPGSTTARIARILQRRGLINNALAFRALARLDGEPTIEAGVYRLAPSMSTARILHELRLGASVRVVRITIPEGFTIDQIGARAAEVPGVSAADWVFLASRRGSSFATTFGAPPNLEGYLFPDSYDFARGTTDREIIQTMLDNFGKKVLEPLADDLRASEKRGYSLGQVITMASLIEREAKVKSDQPLIAGVLYNRLSRKMPLQVDATVQYVVGHKERLLYSDLEVDSPYNTYKVTGLPPGPICNPGLGAIRAALHPATVPYLYYTANPDGTHVFTRTLEEHVLATQESRAEANGG
ncbi:MAG TPA: endolytic transglycosylase MltG [Armatimonadota bacterium]|jgi:UPF0755 protein